MVTVQDHCFPSIVAPEGSYIYHTCILIEFDCKEKYFILLCFLQININFSRLTGEVRNMMSMHQFDEFQMLETMSDANDMQLNILKSVYSNDSGLNTSISGLSTVNEEPDDLQTNPCGSNIPKIVIRQGSIDSQGSNPSLT